MANYADDKTEPATPRRRQEARTKGQVARSQDLPAALLLFVGLWALELFGPRMWQGLILVVRAGLDSDTPVHMSDLWALSGAMMREVAWKLLPLLFVLFLVVALSMFIQVGPLLTLHPLQPSLTKINPLAGIQRLFSMRSVMHAVISVLKLLVVVLVAYLSIWSQLPAILYAFTLDYMSVFHLGTATVFSLGLRIAGALLVLAIIDLVWQRYRHERDLRMTKEEVKDELRSMEGDPKMKARRRQVQFQLALQRLKKDVPKADVIVTNPTHLAVAIHYDVESMPAPKVIAKGQDYMALRIRQIAAEHGIPIVERRPLARALYETVEVGHYIPEKFYRAIAEILAYIYELTGRSPVSRRVVGAAG